MDTAGRGVVKPASRSFASLSARVAALSRSMRATSLGHHSDTSQTSPGASGENTYPPIASTPLASVMLSHNPASLPPGRRRCGASARWQRRAALASRVALGPPAAAGLPPRPSATTRVPPPSPAATPHSHPGGKA
eukprot:1793516-Pleurochrysis_carterae.AAC.1